jgi:putative spermidine/putrescine transport system substrate-binding protein
MTLIPTVYNADTLGIRPDLIKRPIILEPTAQSRIQGQGVDPQHPVDRHHGCGDGGGGHRQHKYADKGNMTKAEIDLTIELPDRKPRRPASSAPSGRILQRVRQPDGLGRNRHPVDVVAGGHRKVRSKGIACTFQPLKEGYRAWASAVLRAEARFRAEARLGL